MSSGIDSFETQQQVVEQIRESRERIDAELSKVIIGQQDVTSQLLISLFAGGHCLITGASGTGKDLAGAFDRPDLPPQVSAHPVHPRLDAGGHHRHGDSGGDRRTAIGSCNLSKGRSLPT